MSNYKQQVEWFIEDWVNEYIKQGYDKWYAVKLAKEKYRDILENSISL